MALHDEESPELLHGHPQVRVLQGILLEDVVELRGKKDGCLVTRFGLHNALYNNIDNWISKQQTLSVECQ